MLFAIRPALEQSKVFDGLNRFLRELMMAALEGRAFDPGALPVGLHAAVDGNQATRDLATALREVLVGLEQERKTALIRELLLDREPCNFLTDRALAVPVIPDGVFSPLKQLSVHLFGRTAKLVGVEACCGECINDHCSRFRAAAAPGNGNVCCVCGTEYLAQVRAGVVENEQWRGPYDHLLAKDEYPLFGVHPGNLLPICHTCNSKSKLAKDLLHKDGQRRLSFSPWTECALPAEVVVTIDDADVFPRVVVHLLGGSVDRQDKLDTWNEVYQIKNRIEGEFLALREKVAEDVTSDSEAEFMADLERRAQAKSGACRVSPFNYWRARVYCSVYAMDQASREALRLAIRQSSPPAQALENLFFN
ncbi:hypothetical protein [Roseateles albus]|uniref:HNH endonuclease n=1 Tax=Roseateles albus TaxID=2987525 RepID=A0ABT5KH64_9BURK|nr:hypothetical protein [Roseateles albus]MDC8773257.1 hypothetical protein [Roseateles albus]